MRAHSLAWLACAACTADVGDLPARPRPDATATMATLDAQMSPDAAVDAARIARTLSQTANDTVVVNAGLACLNSGYTDETSYYRVFDLASAGITEPFHVQLVKFGVESATGTQTVRVKLGTYSGTPGNQLDTGTTDFDGLVTSLGATTAAVPAQDGVTVTADVEVDVPANQKLIVQIQSSSHVGQPASFFLGATNAGQTAPAYLRAPACNVGQPATTAALGFPNSHLLVSVTGWY